MYLWISAIFWVPHMWKWLYFCISLLVKQRSLELFANPILISAVGLYKLAPNSFREILKIAVDPASYLYVYRIFPGYEMSILKEILDNRVAGA